MATHEELRAVRIQKLANLNEAGMNPFTAQTFRTHTIAEALINFDKLANDGLPVTIAGRIMAKRGQGALVFMNLKDGSILIQKLFQTYWKEFIRERDWTVLLYVEELRC